MTSVKMNENNGMAMKTMITGSNDERTMTMTWRIRTIGVMKKEKEKPN